MVVWSILVMVCLERAKNVYEWLKPNLLLLLDVVTPCQLSSLHLVVSGGGRPVLQNLAEEGAGRCIWVQQAVWPREGDSPSIGKLVMVVDVMWCHQTKNIRDPQEIPRICHLATITFERSVCASSLTRPTCRILWARGAFGQSSPTIWTLVTIIYYRVDVIWFFMFVLFCSIS